MPPVVLFPAPGPRKPCLQTVPFSLAHASVQLVLPAAVHQHYSQQAQRLQVLPFNSFIVIHWSRNQQMCYETCDVFQTRPVLLSGFPLGLQSHPTNLARPRPKDPSGKIKNPTTNATEPFGATDYFSSRAEQNGQVRAAARLGGAHQPGRPDPVRVRAQQPRVARRRHGRPGPGGLLPHPVQAAAPTLLLQRRSGKHQESLRVPHQLHKEI